jgi:hypothetical protein
LTSYEELVKCWDINNLQLLYRFDNNAKRAKWDGTLENRSFNLKYVSIEEFRENLKKFKSIVKKQS